MYWEFQRGATYIRVEIQDVMMGCFHLTLNIDLVYYLLLKQTYPCQKFSYFTNIFFASKSANFRKFPQEILPEYENLKVREDSGLSILFLSYPTLSII